MKYRFQLLGFLVVLALLAVEESNTMPVGSGEDAVTGRLVMLDCYFNNEWKKDSQGMPFRYHYVWDDTTDSGFSQLAGIIKEIGGAVDTLCGAPTQEALRRARVYVIVDPDTPEETKHLHYIDQEAINVITGWVEEGGMLVLLGNDKGKAEFEHFNQLAGRFGIQFNEDSRNKVFGREFKTGTFDSLPDHPLFHGVDRIFIKELSTLRVQQPAMAIFSRGGDVIMAFSKIGKGGVFALGDPWLYNEYMDQRRLPAGYDNARAAENLIQWLLQQQSEH